MDFLGVAVAEPQAYQKAAGFRITEAAQQRISLGALSVWLRKGEIDAQNIDTAAYDAQTFGGLSAQHPEYDRPKARDVSACDEDALRGFGSGVLHGERTPQERGERSYPLVD